MSVAGNHRPSQGSHPSATDSATTSPGPSAPSKRYATTRSKPVSARISRTAVAQHSATEAAERSRPSARRTPW